MSLACEVKLAQPHDRAIETVTAALKSEGFGVLTRIDAHTTFREKLGVEFRPYSILGACNPPLAHRVLSHRAEAGLLLPCNVTVEAEGSGSLVRIGDPDVMLSVGGMAPCGLSASSQTLKRTVVGFEKQRLTDCMGAMVTESCRTPNWENPL